MEALSKPIIVASAAILIFLSLLNFAVSGIEDVIALIPINTLITKTYAWNVITCNFFETNVFKLIFDVAVLLLVSRNIQIVNFEQFALYYVGSLVSGSLTTSTVCFVSFFASKAEESLVTPVYGFGGILMAVMMFARQQLKGRCVHDSVPGVTYHNLPVLLLLLQFILWLVGGGGLVLDSYFSLFSMLFSWSYLRFYYRFDENSEGLGDSSEDFTFVSMFPQALQPIVVPFSTAFYNIGALAGIYPALEQADKKIQHHLRYTDPAAPMDMTMSDLSASNAEAGRAGNATSERRRAKALKLLEQKMGELSRDSGGWDDKDEEAASSPTDASTATSASATAAASAAVAPLESIGVSKKASFAELNPVKI